MQGPLGNYGIAKSLVQTPGWKPLEAEEGGMMPQGGRGGGGFSMGLGGGEYRGRIGADTSNLPPSQRGLYENSAPSKEAIQSAYNANLKNGMTHAEIMKLFNDQADRDAKFWAEGFAKDPNFSQTLYDKSQAIVAKPYGTTAASGKAYAQKLKTQQKNKSLLAASRGAFNHNQPPRVGSWSPGGTVKAAPKVTKTVWKTPTGQRIGGRYGL